MISITNIRVHIPGGRQSLGDCAQELDLNRFETRMFQRLHGLDTLVHAEQTPLDAHLKAALPAGPDPDHLFHCHTIPAITPGGASAFEQCAAPGAQVAGVAMAHCAGPLVILQMLGHALPAHETARIVVGERAFHPKIKLIPNVTLMSEIAVSIDVAHGPGLCRHIDSVTRVSGSVALNSGLCSNGGVPPGFEMEYQRVLREAVFGVLDRQGMGWEDIAWLFPHNVNTSSWRSFAKDNGVSVDRVYLGNVSRYAHAFGADPFLNFKTALDAGEIGPGARALFVSVGLGMTANATLVEVTAPPSKFTEGLTQCR